MQAVRALGATARPVLYGDEAVREIRDELLSCDAVLVWANPLDISGDRSQPDPMLREVAGCGVDVSAHPDVIATIGVKEVLYPTRSMEDRQTVGSGKSVSVSVVFGGSGSFKTNRSIPVV